MRLRNACAIACLSVQKIRLLSVFSAVWLITFLFACGNAGSQPAASSPAGAAVAATTASDEYTGPMDLTGQWTATVGALLTLPNQTPGIGTQLPVSYGLQSLDVKQYGNEITMAGVTSGGFLSTCNGSLNGEIALLRCTITSMDKTCHSAEGIPIAMAIDQSVFPPTFTLGFNWTALGSSCPSAGVQVTGYSGTFTKVSVPPVRVAGTWNTTSDLVTITGPGLPTVGPYSNLGTKVRRQEGSIVYGSGSFADGTATTCVGPIVGNVISFYCEGSNNGCTFSGTDITTINTTASPLTDTFNITWTLSSSSCGGYTAGTATGTDTFLSR